MDSQTANHMPFGPSKTFNELIVQWLKRSSPWGIFTVDEGMRITSWNRWMVFHTRWKPETVVGMGLNDLYPNLLKRKMDKYFRLALLGQTVILSHTLHDYLLPVESASAQDGFKYMPQSATLSPLERDGNVLGVIACIENVTQRVSQEQELENRIQELEKAIKEVKTLKGLLPICSYCKNIRDDKGYWKRLEVYLGEHSNVDFTHGICPECAKKHFPEMNLYGENDEEDECRVTNDE